jgi:hypothetical protein
MALMQPRSQGKRTYWWLLILPFAGLLFPGLYARAEPSLFGFPFFYWYQFAWLLASSGLTWFVYLRSR